MAQFYACKFSFKTENKHFMQVLHLEMAKVKIIGLIMYSSIILTKVLSLFLYYWGFMQKQMGHYSHTNKCEVLFGRIVF
jgi:hypothetical protein